MSRFVDAAKRKSAGAYNGADRISGTNKIRTYCANPALYSQESSLRKIASDQYYPAGAKQER
jgi:hypothetical protein